MKKWQKIPIIEKERKAVKQAESVLRKQFPIHRVILFGSKARGDYDEHSDIDLLLITLKKLNWKKEKAIVETLFDLGMEYDVIFSTLFASVDEWEDEPFTAFPIYQEITRDGAVVQ